MDTKQNKQDTFNLITHFECDCFDNYPVDGAYGVLRYDKKSLLFTFVYVCPICKNPCLIENMGVVKIEYIESEL